MCHGLNAVIDCIDSVVANTRPGSYRLYLIDDYSDCRIREYLDNFSRNRPDVQVVSHTGNRGFLNACSFGITLGDAPYVALVDSATVLPPDWLGRLTACAESHPKAMIVRPLSNAGSAPLLPMFPGASFLDMNAWLLRHFREKTEDIRSEISVCTLLKRALLEERRLAAPESGGTVPLCRITMSESRHRAVVACDTYIYHRTDSFDSPRDVSFPTNRFSIPCRCIAECRRQYRHNRTPKTLKMIRSRFVGRLRWDPLPVVWETARNAVACAKDNRPMPLLGSALAGLMRMPFSIRRLPSSGFVQELTRPHRLRVTYILHKMVIAGGVLSVIQIVNSLICLGIEARIVTFFKDPKIREWTRLYTEPIVYGSENEMKANFPPTDIAVATLWNTAPIVAQLVRQGKARMGAYFIQDYEPWFFPESDEVSRQRVQRTYSLIPNRIVKSRWLAGMLAADGYRTHQIPLGMDLGQFYPRNADRTRPVILSMVRPKTPYRGFAPTIAALAEVKKQMPAVEIVLFGDRFLASHSIPFAFRDEGVVMDPNQLAELYSEATVFLDGSDFQGFGRCGLEAMACGAACVLTGAGGVMEYAVDGENAQVVPPKKPDRFAAAILELLHNPSLRSRLIEGGRQTALRFCHKREAHRTLVYFLSLTAGCGSYPVIEDGWT